MIWPNGAGKSTALKAICGLLNSRSGEVLFQGENINSKQSYQLVEKGGYQLKAGHFSPFWLYGNSTIKQNLRSC